MKGKAKPRSGGRPSKAAEELFLKATAEVFRTEFPTPEGSRRFDSAAVKAAAYRCHRERLPDDLVDEMTWCSETFADFERYLKEARFARRMRFLAACAVLVLSVGGGLWWYLAATGSPSAQEPMLGREDVPKQEAPAPLPQPEAPQRQEPAPEQTFQVAVLDLRLRGTVRGQGQEAPSEVPVLPARRLELTVYLPIGSQEGEYGIVVARSQGEQPLATAQATVRLVDYIATAKTRLDLSSLDPGSYSLELRRGQFAAGYFEVRVE